MGSINAFPIKESRDRALFIFSNIVKSFYISRFDFFLMFWKNINLVHAQGYKCFHFVKDKLQLVIFEIKCES